MSNKHRQMQGDAATGAGRKPNRLGDESSLYLLQHAFNPVDWHPWGTDAFELARRLDRPIFLSIGYSTCYWCHVMERECFENEAIATVMNELFICIKVDREQRPDVDDLYMTGVQLMTGAGGWPMSMFLEPTTLKPFYGGTYFPPEDRYGRPGFPAVLHGVENAWRNNRDAVMQQADRIAQAIAQQLAVDARRVPLNQSQVDLAVRGLMSVYDTVDGGFGGGGSGGGSGGENGGGSKFPQPANLDMLIAVAWHQPSVRNAVLHTLDRMATGGMYDQIGGGFHRYSVDSRWRVPHFEKMLYDNAQLVSTYARAYELSGDSFCARIAGDTLAYVLREMTSQDGGFFSAQDAEVKAREGGNYVWTQQQMRDALLSQGLPDDVEFAMEVFGVDQGPNFRDPHHPDAGAVNVLLLPLRPDRLARKMNLDAAIFHARLERVKAALLEVRNQRDQPATDDKIIAGWNGLMIAGFADAGRVLDRPEFIIAAERAAEFVLSAMRNADGGLLRIHRAGRSEIDAFLEDHAFMIRGLLALHRANDQHRWLDDAARLARFARERYWDQAHGGWFDTREGQQDLFVRIKSVHDGAVPSGSGIMLLNMLDLAQRTGEQHWLDDARTALDATSSAIAQHPAGCVLSIIALNQMLASRPTAASNMAGDADEIVRIAVTPVQAATDDADVREWLVRLDIKPPWHMNAADPGSEDVQPLRIALLDAPNATVHVAYPRASAFQVAGMPAIRVYSEVVDLPVRIDCDGELPASLRLLIEYQACDDRACQMPKQVIIDLAGMKSIDE